MAIEGPRFIVRTVELFERPVHLRLPFRFGVVTLTHCPQAFVRAQVALPNGRAAWGGAGELMAPKWFDKNLQLTNEDNFDQLRHALLAARQAYLSDMRADTAFGHFARHHQALIDLGAAQGRNALVSCYGPALLDRAILDALCRALGLSFYDAVKSNTVGIDARLTPDLAGFDVGDFLASLSPAPSIEVRHTVGLLDAITAVDVREPVNDGLPETLADVVSATGCRWYKLKVSGQVDADMERLTRIAAVLRRVSDARITLDGNEQFTDAQAAAAFWRRVMATPALHQLAEQVKYIEQPLARAIALDSDVGALAAMRPVLIDESDDTLQAFPRALELGYTGVSSKQCKGIYRSLLNAARCRQRNGSKAVCFMSAEDLTTQAGLAVQQDLALVNLIGLTHVERNGYYYVNGFAGQGASPTEAAAFAQAQPGLYEPVEGGNVRLHVQAGRLDLRSLAAPGFAASAQPDWASLPTLRKPTDAIP